jgi:5-methylcytosine-specific restriction endonuclease McrA
LITDIQEIKVSRENVLKFYPSPNPYNPDDYALMDKAMKRAILKDQRLSKLKRKLLASQNGLCAICGEIINLDEEAVERDHIVPKMEGGKDTFKNMAILHKVCHQKKTSWERK